MTILDPQKSSFSQAQGYEALPGQLRLEEMSEQARVRFWNALIAASSDVSDFGYADRWREIFISIYSDFLNMPLNSGMIQLAGLQRSFDSPIEQFIMKQPFNKVFVLLLAVMRHPKCPSHTVIQIADAFQDCQLAYFVDLGPPPTIYPSTTPEEGLALVDSLDQLRSAGLAAARQHLRTAAENINQQEWTGSVRESIHAVESVARLIAPQAKTLGEALRVLGKNGLLEHKALREGFNKIYGYTNDENGIRHALLDERESNVGREEAVFMLGACASFASYLNRKHLSLENRDRG